MEGKPDERGPREKPREPQEEEGEKKRDPLIYQPRPPDRMPHEHPLALVRNVRVRHALDHGHHTGHATSTPIPGRPAHASTRSIRIGNRPRHPSAHTRDEHPVRRSPHAMNASRSSQQSRVGRFDDGDTAHAVSDCESGYFKVDIVAFLNSSSRVKSSELADPRYPAITARAPLPPAGSDAPWQMGRLRGLKNAPGSHEAFACVE